MAQGPLVGVKVVEFAGIGPGPFCGMLLADMGADVVRIDRAEGRGFPDLANRGKRSIALDLKKAEGVEAALSLIDQADALLEGFRPGVMERLGVGPDVALKRNPKLVYGRMTGWGQTGPWSSMAGHDIDYIALTGALHTMGRKGEPPAPPLNLVGDFGGGALYLAMGLLAGIIEARTSGKGQVVDCAMIDGAASLMTMFYGMKAAGMWSPERDSNLLDGGAHFYDTYECADGQWLAIGSIEPQFHALLVKGLGLPDDAFGSYMDRTKWPEFSRRLAEIVKTKSRDDWMKVFDGTDACVAPVLSMDEAPGHPHNAARSTFVEAFGMVQPGPAPRFSRTAGAVNGPPALAGKHSTDVLSSWGVDPEQVKRFVAAGVVSQT
ncbi:MAG TPA: CaiB/BaiF CoA-transferase family protein [Hyphomonadaceae bacterium]|nr:CaiB/BaiF CoA-transferase family protein [Hyphomonadaceae bacterium]